ncbi:hypothetical protein GCM10009000_090530 [Halobacterium noricense]|uniref:D-isomer specific 2-hydroxyacid dehydrogenase catalytic domain-containing protein n=1 Tax=Haladaptatus pallidirubidus TaxID=1008152 RepID=A0AAV3UPB3_9EURY
MHIVIDRLLAIPYSSDAIDRLKNCTVIARFGIGLDAVNSAYAAEYGIHVVHTSEYCQNDVADRTMALMLATKR